MSELQKEKEGGEGMRDILFKAKTVKTGKWVEGLLWRKKYKSKTLYISCFPDQDDHEEVYCVNPGTVCQYTGLTDKNGQKIWENDIIQLEDRICHIYWLDKNAQFDCKFIKHNKDIVITNFKGVEPREYEDYEIIGNVFDNPELLKGGGAE